jgi:enoyl-CoA hydratase
MPETGIGLFPDVGGGWHLSRLPGHIGMWLALTGARIGPGDCELLGLATDFVASADVERLKARILAEPSAVETILTELEADAGRPPLADHQDEIDRCFGGASVEAIFEALANADSEWARAQLAALRTKSPQTLKVAHRQLREGAGMATFADEMIQEYAIGARVVQLPDFLEGVRAVIVDKDNAPKWRPADLTGVDDDLLDRIFAPLPADQAWTPLP